jgi:hypothetical protein
MNNSALPDPQKVQKTVMRLKEVCHQFDALNVTLDELIAQADKEIQNNPLTIHRSKKSRATKSA